MSLTKVTNYAPDIYKALNGILLVYKPPRVHYKEFIQELRNRISDDLNRYSPRPLAKRICIEGGLEDEKHVVERPNLADHPLVAGPRYMPWELSMSYIQPLGYRSSGVSTFLIGSANRLQVKMKQIRLVNIYEIKAQFGHITDTNFYDGKVQDKTTFHHIKANKIDAALSRIEAVQYERLFDAANVQYGSEEAYQLAKAWPSRPPRMAEWPVIYRIRCTHFDPPHFKLEVTITNENEHFLAQISRDIGLMLKSGAFTNSIRRIKHGIFTIDQCLTEKDYDMQSIINNLAIHNSKIDDIRQFLQEHYRAIKVTTTRDHGRPSCERKYNQ